MKRVRISKTAENPDDEPTTPDAKVVRDISERVYRERLGKDATARMIGDDGDGGVKLRARAGSYDGLTRVYMRVLQQGGKK